MISAYNKLFMIPDIDNIIVNTDELIDINIIKEFLKKPEQQILEEFPFSAIMLEEYVVKLIGGIWNRGVNGADGWLNNRDIEVKSQIYQINSDTKNGAFQLRGRGKFSGCSRAVYDEKLKNNEVVCFVGADSNSNIYYIMSVEFKDIADFYLSKLPSILVNQYSNIDVLPKQYKDAPSFKIHYIRPNIEDCLYDKHGNKQFTKNFFKLLCESTVTMPLKEMKNFYVKYNVL